MPAYVWGLVARRMKRVAPDPPDQGPMDTMNVIETRRGSRDEDPAPKGLPELADFAELARKGSTNVQQLVSTSSWCRRSILDGGL